MKTPLTPLYDLFGAIGAVFILLTLLVQVVTIVGREFGVTLAGYDSYAGLCSLAAGSFFALAHTLRRGDHIRVTLILSRLHGRTRLWAEVVLPCGRFLPDQLFRLVQHPPGVGLVRDGRHLAERRRDATLAAATRNGARRQRCSRWRSSRS